MGSQTATFVILFIYVAVMISIGVYTSRKTKSAEDFMLGGRSVGSWLTAFSYGTTYFSAVVFIGYAGQFGWLYGASASWVGIGNAIIGSLIPFFLIGRRTRLMSNHLGARTMPEFFEHRFDSKKLKTAAAAIVFIFLIPYTASVYNGLSRLFGMVFDLGENGQGDFHLPRHQILLLRQGSEKTEPVKGIFFRNLHGMYTSSNITTMLQKYNNLY